MTLAEPRNCPDVIGFLAYELLLSGFGCCGNGFSRPLGHCSLGTKKGSTWGWHPDGVGKMPWIWEKSWMENGELKWDTVKCSELRSYIFKMFRHGPKCFCAILLPGSRFWSLEPRFYEDVKIWGFGYGKRDLWCNHYHPRQHWLGQLQGCNVDDFKRPSRHWNMANAKGMLWMEDTHTHIIYQHPTTDVTYHVFLHRSFCSTLPEAFGWWGPGLLSKRGARPKNPKSWSIEVFFMEDFHPPLYDTCPQKWGWWIGGIQFHCQPRFFWNVCGWAITVAICRYLILPSMVCLKLSKGCGFRWRVHWHLGSVYFEKSQNKSTSQYILVGVFRRF